MPRGPKPIEQDWSQIPKDAVNAYHGYMLPGWRFPESIHESPNKDKKKKKDSSSK